MESAPRWLFHAFTAFILPFSALAEKPAKKKGATPSSVPAAAAPVDIEQIREELGVNQFTAPSIEQVLAELMELRPIQIEKVWRDLPKGTPQNRARLALVSGRVIADGLLAVIAEKPSRVEPCARALLRFAKGLGVSEHVTKHSKSIIERVAKEDWNDVRHELVKAQVDVEAGMLGLKDEELAHLVSLGGWLRGLEIVSTLVADDFTQARAQRLVQPEALDYFIDRIGTLNPNLKAKAVFQEIEEALQAIHEVIAKPDKSPLTVDDVKKVRDLAKDVNVKIADTGAKPEE